MADQYRKHSNFTGWLNAEDLSSLKGLEWIARKVAMEAISGVHGGKRLGQGTDFSQYRSYMPGDDLRRIDWKVYGRTDRLYLKESELESRTRWYGILDASASMKYEEGGISKWQYAKVLWAAIVYIARQQGDQDGLVLVNDQSLLHMPPMQGAENARAQRLFEESAKGKWPKQVSLPLMQAGFQNKFIIITDLYEQGNEMGAFIRSLLPAKNEVVIFHIMGKQEIELDFAGVTLFEDAETGKLVETDPKRIRQEYHKQVTDYLENCRQEILRLGASYHLCKLPYSPVNQLKEFLNKKPGRSYVGI